MNRILTAVALAWVLAIALAAWWVWSVLTVADADSETVIGCADTPIGYDLNGDGGVSSIDQMCLAKHYGEGFWTATSIATTPSSMPSNTPTSTSTPVPTHTTGASPTATHTPTVSPSIQIQTIIADSTGQHDGCLDDSLGTYDWRYSARPGTYTGSAYLTPWYQIAWDHCASGTGQVHLRNFRGYKLTSAGWQSIGSGPDIGQWGNYTISFQGSCTGWRATAEPGGLAFSPSADRSCIAHGWTWPRGLASGMICALVKIDVSGSGPFLLNVGLDMYDGDTYRGDIGIGAFRRVGPEWRTVYQSSCSESQLTGALPLP